MANKFQWDLMQIEKFHFEIELTSNAHESCGQLKDNPCFFRKIATMQHQVKIIDFINIIIKCAHKLLHKLNEYLQFLFLSNFVKSVLVHLVKL